MSHLHFFKSGGDNVVEIWFDATGEFPVKDPPDIDFIDEAVVQCYVPVVKMLL